jgi:hypothetical protein
MKNLGRLIANSQTSKLVPDVIFVANGQKFICDVQAENQAQVIELIKQRYNTSDITFTF